MNKKIKCLFVVSIFLTVIFGTCLSAEAINLVKEKPIKENLNPDPIGASLTIHVYYKDWAHNSCRVHGAVVTVKDLETSKTKIKLTNLRGNARFVTGIVSGNTYRVTVTSSIQLTFDTAKTTITVSGNDVKNIRVYNVEKRTRSVNINPMLTEFLDQFPLLQQL